MDQSKIEPILKARNGTILKIEDLSKIELIDLVKNLQVKKKYGLMWEEDKSREHIEFDNNLILPTLNESKNLRICSNSDEQANYLIEGDNFYALQILQFTHAGKIDLIYIDPPYNTGNKDFKYNDVWVDKEDTFRHSKWLSFMSKRLTLAKELLTSDGAIFVSIDDNEYARLVMLMEDIFGEKNVKTVVVKMSEATGVKMASAKISGTIPKLKEYLVIAKKDGIRNLHIEKIPKEKWDDEYKQFIINATESDLDLVKSIKESENRTPSELAEIENLIKSWKVEPLSSTYARLGIKDKEKQSNFRYENAWRIFRTASIEGGAKSIAIKKKKAFKIVPNYYLITTPRSKCYIIDGSVNPDTPSPRCKLLFADEYLTVHPGDLWVDIKTTGLENEGGVVFKNGKEPLKLIERIIKMSSKRDLLVLDFFAGSGTTGEAVMRLNAQDSGKRKFILVTDNEDNICKEITYVRMQNAINGYKEQDGELIGGLGGNLSYFTIKLIKKSLNTDEMKIRIMDNCTDLLCFKDGVFSEVGVSTDSYKIFRNGDGILGIYNSFDQSDLENMKINLDKYENIFKKAYIFTFDNFGLNPNDFIDWKDVELEPMPQKILEILGGLNA